MLESVKPGRSVFNSISGQMFSQLKTIPSSYSVAITIGDEYATSALYSKKAMDAVLESLKRLKKKKWKRAPLYHSASGTLLNPEGDFDGSSQGMSSKTHAGLESALSTIS
jgi:hypothetical protein